MQLVVTMSVFVGRLRSLAVLLIVVIAGACAGAPTATSTGRASAPESPSPSPTLTTLAPSPSPSVEASCANQTFARLTEAQRIGQLFNVGLDNDRLDAASRRAITDNHFGSVWYGAKTSIGVAGVRKVADAVQALATDEATGGVDFFVAANQEGGLIQALSGSGFDTIPSAVAQGELAVAELEAKVAVWGRQLRDAGVNLDFAPVADVVAAGAEARNAPIGQLKREYGNQPSVVATHVVAFINGMRQAGVATAAKHFPGLGRVEGNTDFTSAVIDTVTTATDPYIEPFSSALTAGVPFVMISLATYDRIDSDHLAAFSPVVIERILRRELGFDGVVMSDSLTAHAVADMSPAQRAIDFVEAGGDMIVLGPIDVAVPMAQALAERATSEATFRARIDQSALRILEAKDAAGLLPCSG
jgi:beta-N-acetylhexosaminidase